MIKGQHHSEKSKARLRTSALNQFRNGFPEKTRKKLRLARRGKKPMLGKKHSQETIALFKRTRKLWWNDPEFRRKSLENRIKLFGSKNPAWKGGVTPVILLIRQSEKYKKWRIEVYKKGKFKCQLCGYQHKKGTPRKILDADHVIPFAFLIQKLIREKGKSDLYKKAMIFGPLWDLENGRVLCRSCHKKTDTFLNRWHKKFKEYEK